MYLESELRYFVVAMMVSIVVSSHRNKYRHVSDLVSVELEG